jgi:putative nucleotidyltransferase with HDIG domain
VRTVATPHDALALLGQEAFAAVAADYDLPTMNGIELLMRVARAQPEAVRILVSGRKDPDLVIEGLNRAGIFQFVHKPWDGTSLRRMVQQAMLHHRTLADHRALLVRLNDLAVQLQQVNRDLDARVAERTSQLFLSLCNALDLRDTDTQWHSRRVALYTRRLAEAVGIRGLELLDIERGALLHDIGKIGVSDTILLKPARLTDEEWVQMRKHSDLGAQILNGIPFLERARRLVLEHHERWDGGGYNQRLRGEEIYIGARIFAVIDAFDAMTADRPYRRAPGHERAMEEILAGRGTQFDPRVVEAFCRIPEQDLEDLRRRASQGEAGLE